MEFIYFGVGILTGALVSALYFRKGRNSALRQMYTNGATDVLMKHREEYGNDENLEFCKKLSELVKDGSTNIK